MPKREHHDIGYFMSEGAKNMFTHGFMSFAAIGITVACLLIMGTFTLVAVNADANLQELEDTSGGELCKTKLVPRLRVPAGLAPAGERPLHYSDCDINGHVNNVRYADFACDALHLEELGRGAFVSSMQLGYLRECRAGESLRLSAGASGGTWYVQGDGAEGQARFDAALVLSPLDDLRERA